MSGKPEIRIDWASHDAARHACENWHYSKCLPVGKLVKVGAWEDGKYIGCVIFGRGANINMLKPFGLEQDQGCELVRIALTTHVTPVSKIMTLAIRLLKKSQAGLQLVVSYADPDQGHHGGIYQACNWIYTGAGSKEGKVLYQGKWVHRKTIHSAGVKQANLPTKYVEGKHRYLMALDKQMAAKIAPLAKPYPKRVKQAMAGVQPAQRQCNTDLPAPNPEADHATN